jgi:hypothetical protein
MSSDLAQRRPQTVAEATPVDYDRALAYLGLNRNDPRAHALVLVCARYRLDPILGHASLYDGKPYIHYAGYLHIANSHPQYEGAETVREWDDDEWCYATVRVHRSDRKFAAERTGKSRKQKPKKNGGTYLDDDADAKAFAQAHRRALRLAFTIDAPELGEDHGEVQPAPEPVVEVSRMVQELSDPGATVPPGGPGADPTSGVVGEREPGLKRDRRDDPTSPDPTSGVVAGDGFGEGPIAATPDPTSDHDPEGGEATEQAEATEGGSGVVARGELPPEPSPVGTWCGEHGFPIRQARVVLRRLHRDEFADLADWRDLQELRGDRAAKAIAYLEAATLGAGQVLRLRNAPEGGL